MFVEFLVQQVQAAAVQLLLTQQSVMDNVALLQTIDACQAIHLKKIQAFGKEIKTPYIYQQDNPYLLDICSLQPRCHDFINWLYCLCAFLPVHRTHLSMAFKRLQTIDGTQYFSVCVNTIASIN